MAQRRIEHTFECNPATFWSDIFFDEGYNQQVFVQRLKFERWAIVERQDTAEGFRRVIEAVPSVGDLPGPIKALLKNGAGYREVGRFLEGSSRYEFEVVSNSLGERLQVAGVVTVEPVDGGRCRRVQTLDVRAKVFGIGSMLENHIIDNMVKGYEKSARHTQRWLAERAG